MFLQPSGGSSFGLDELVKLSDLISNKKEAKAFLDDIAKQRAALEEEHRKIQDERNELLKVRNVKTAVKDLDKYTKDSKAKAESIITSAKEQSAEIIMDARDKEREAEVVLFSVQKQQIDLKTKQKQLDSLVEKASKELERASQYKEDAKKEHEAVKERAEKVASLVGELKNV